MPVINVIANIMQSIRLQILGLHVSADKCNGLGETLIPAVQH